MIKVRVFLYDSTQGANGYRGTELSENVLQGAKNVQDLTQELDTSEITIYFRDNKDAFIPQTKFIIDFEQDGEVVETVHRMVEEDTVTQPNIAEDIYKHSISLIEPSVVAQKRVVDNMGTTYKLKDVTLASEPTVDTNALSGFFISGYVPTVSQNFGFELGDRNWIEREHWGKVLRFDGSPIWKTNDGTVVQTQNKKYFDISDFEVDGEYKAKLQLPKLKLFYGVDDTTQLSTTGIPVSYSYTITAYNSGGEEVNRITGNIIENSDLSSVPCPTQQEFGGDGWTNLRKEWLLEYVTRPDGVASAQNSKIISVNGRRVFARRYTDISALAPSYTTDAFTINPLYTYKVSFNLSTLNDQSEIPYCPFLAGRLEKANDKVATDVYLKQVDGGQDFNVTQVLLPTENYLQEAEYVPCVLTDPPQENTLVSGEIYSAYSLVIKAILNSYVGDKEADKSCVDLKETNCPFYVDENFVYDLQEAQVVENLYSQKNLWEILIEAGYYIHAIPEIVFGDNEKFKITFNRLGETNENTQKTTRINITNFRGVDDYISATNSYITNLVEIGGEFDEWIPAKSNSEDFLIENSNAIIETSKPIKEILYLGVRYKDDDDEDFQGEADLTPFVFEKYVYQIFDIIPTSVPNKGTAIYYELDSNVLQGLNYRLPVENVNPYNDYTIKKIIWKAFSDESWDYGKTHNSWEHIKVNDFVFHIRYRTQDSLRLVHTRPDIRKYLLDTPLDIVPKHEQINNQEDVVVDSLKFGSNMYGTLIRTGNLNYQEQEYVTDLTKIKRKGEIVRINNEIYYVSKVTTTYFPNHAISIVDYSKDYNQLSKVIGIPSEPRFSEISERSTIRREVAINDYLLVTDTYVDLVGGNNTKKELLQDKSHLLELIFGDVADEDNVDYAKYVVTTFKGDKDIGIKHGTFGVPSHYVDILSPINAYSSGTTLSYEWDMLDNYGAGNQSVWKTGFYGEQNAYRSLLEYKYCDKYGKSTLFDFYIIKALSNNLNYNQIMALPESPFQTSNPTPSAGDLPFIMSEDVLVSNRWQANDDNHNRGKILLKDCREAISFSYNLQAISVSDTFVFSPFFFTKGKRNTKLVALSKETNKLSGGFINTADIVQVDNEPLTVDIDDSLISKVTYTDDFNKTKVARFSLLVNTAFSHFLPQSIRSQIKSIAVIYDYDATKEKQKFVLARNRAYGTTVMQFGDWDFGSPNKTRIFNVKQ